MVSDTPYFFSASASTEIYTLSLHDALPIFGDEIHVRIVEPGQLREPDPRRVEQLEHREVTRSLDRKSTRLNSSHVAISYAVFCLKKKQPRSRSRVLRITARCLGMSSEARIA